MTPFELGRGPREKETCIRCLEQKDATDIDRRHWCRECRELARERAKSEGWKAGAVFAAFLALYIWIFVGPSTLILGAWIASVFAAFWLVSKIAREVHYGVARYRNEPAVEAKPPVGLGDEEEARNETREEGGSEESGSGDGGSEDDGSGDDGLENGGSEGSSRESRR